MSVSMSRIQSSVGSIYALSCVVGVSNQVNPLTCCHITAGAWSACWRACMHDTSVGSLPDISLQWGAPWGAEWPLGGTDGQINKNKCIYNFYIIMEKNKSADTCNGGRLIYFIAAM